MRDIAARGARLACAAAVIAAGALATLPASASANDCNDEATLVMGGDELGVDVSGAVFVGVDLGGLQGTDDEDGVCAESSYVHVDDSPGTPTVTPGGCAVDVLGGGCDAPGVRIGLDDEDSEPVLQVGDEVILSDDCVVAIAAGC